LEEEQEGEEKEEEKEKQEEEQEEEEEEEEEEEQDEKEEDEEEIIWQAISGRPYHRAAWPVAHALQLLVDDHLAHQRVRGLVRQVKHLGQNIQRHGRVLGRKLEQVGPHSLLQVKPSIKQRRRVQARCATEEIASNAR
jgi:hypothetical protein